jgi:hypothetical protein
LKTHIYVKGGNSTNVQIIYVLSYEYMPFDSK